MIKAKGVQKAALKEITFDDYYNSLFYYEKPIVIISHKHEVYTVQQKKVALNPHDDKRMVRFRSTDTLPWGFNG